jgi:hypothetical protein
MEVHMMPTPPNVFAAYAQEFFVPTPHWHKIERILGDRRGGNYGLVGPRGAGKSWIMHQAVARADGDHGLGVWFPSPSEYDAKAFLASLSEVTAQKYIDSYLDKLKYGTQSELLGRQSVRSALVVSILGFVGAMLAFGIALYGNKLDVVSVGGRSGQYIATVATGCLMTILAWVVFRKRRRAKPLDEQLYDRANEIRLQARYTAAHKESGETTARVSTRGLVVGTKRARELALAERPSTISSLIHDFRSFVERIAHSQYGPLIIAIDELDKMASGDQVAKLLRDIKGVFDVPGVHFLVSISDEAAKSLTLGSLRARNEFNSSFYQVFQLPPMTVAGCDEILQRRGLSFGVHELRCLAVLSGGIPREVVRLADVLASRHPAASRAGSAPLWHILETELIMLQREIERMSEERSMSAADETRVHSVHRTGPTQLDLAFKVDFLDDALWTPCDAGPEWDGIVARQWRRMLLRLAVARVLAGNKTIATDTIDALQTIIRRGEESAVTARMLMRDLSP